MSFETFNATGTVNVLSQTTGINLKSTGATTLLTTNSSRKTVITRIIVHVTAATSYTVGAQLSVGQNSATYNDILANTTMTAMAADSADILSPSNPFVVVGTSTAIKVNINTGATATSATAEVFLLGFLI